MASSIAAAPIVVDHQEEHQQTRPLNPPNHHPSNRRRRRRNNGNGNSDGCCCSTSFVSYMLISSLVSKFIQNGWIIYLNEVKEYSYFYMVETFILFVLGCLLVYVAFVPRKLYIMKIASIVFGILFILDLVMILFIVDNQCYSRYENGTIKPLPKHYCTNLISFPAASLFSIFLSTIWTFLIYYLIKYQ